MRRLKLREIAGVTGGRLVERGLDSRTINRISTDSREVRPGDLFWAIRGERYDGHTFVNESLSIGAVGAVVERSFSGSGPLLRVEDTRKALSLFARWYRKSQSATVIAVTGSVGKTSTREAIFAVLSKRWYGVQSPASFNNDIGVPISLLLLESKHDFAVIELGASGPGEIGRLAKITEPQVGVFTAITAAHLEGFGTVRRVASAKAELLHVLGTDGTAILNSDDPQLRAIGKNAKCKVVWFGTQSRSHVPDVMGHEIEARGPTVSFRCNGGPRASIAAAGRHQVYPALAAMAVGQVFGMNDMEIAGGFRTYRPPPMRCQIEQCGKITVINDTYNANPASVRAALDVLCNWPTDGRRLLVLGDMNELGTAGPRYHRSIGKEIVRRRVIDLCIAIGPLSRHTVVGASYGNNRPILSHYTSVDDVGNRLWEILEPGDVVLFKASRAMKLEELVAGLHKNYGTTFGGIAGAVRTAA